MKVLLRYRRPLVVAIHVLLAGLVHYAAFLLRFDGEIPAEQAYLLVQMLPWLLVMRGIIFMPFGLYHGLWRYASIWDLRNIVAGVLTSELVFYFVVRWGLGFAAYPRSVFVIDAVLLIVMLGGLRLARRIHREFAHAAKDKRILIYGAGDAGEMIVRDMRHNPLYEFEPIGFIDDDATKMGQRIHGVKVLGTRQALGRVVAGERPDAVLLAMPSAEAATIRSIVRTLEPLRVAIQTLPNLRDVFDGKLTITQIRRLSVEDLLERAPVDLDVGTVRHLIGGKRVLVSGAGGTIGSELSRQIAALGPAALVLLDRYENGLYGVITELSRQHPGSPVEGVIGDVADAERVALLLRERRPEIIFHAAAHKHVPLMELNACEAVKNNVRGTRILAEAALASAVERFILISTDKAVNPSSVMGATKRVSEFIVQSMNGRGGGTFAAVRFGNVLGSNGSVVPHFLEQIKAGGPVTVTHAEMRRYFMLIPEAVHLVLQGAALAQGGDIFVLDMGEQLKVLDLARNLIRLSGFVPEEEIPITFVGVRPGEKLYEELIGKDETAEAVSGQKILRVNSSIVLDRSLLRGQVAELERLAAASAAAAVVKKLCELVPTYQPSGEFHA